jgi:anti-anti-sigma factor
MSAREMVDPSDPSAPDRAFTFGFDSATRRVTVRGELDFANCSVLADVIKTLLQANPGRMTIDIEKLVFTDAASMTLFLASCTALSTEATSLRIVGATPTVHSACQAAGLDASLAPQAFGDA